MRKIDFKSKNNRYFPLFYELAKEKGISDSAMVIYGFFYNHCINLNDNGWCGLSDEHLAEKLRYSLRSFQRYLKELVDANMVIIENSGKKTRRIYINAENHVSVQEVDDSAEIIKQQAEEIKKLKQQLEQVSSRVEPGNWMVIKLARKGFLTTAEYNDAHAYNVIFDEFLKETSWGYVDSFLTYFDTDPKTVKDKYAYLVSSIRNQINRYKSRE
ncbi:helix-turn-helix domain-containing protein [Methanosphaera sp.]|uniref:helix-turn-helix domain-containing protein n=1 Tax=Methanosphaera sp. TaxID=2666342 RepID=UPI0025FD0EE6|nr:helix-turn-helix domain-containing protein [Methanosphaera sp.]